MKSWKPLTIACLVFPFYYSYAQIYAPELKIENTNGYIGINNPVPSVALDVNGKIKIPAANSIEDKSPAIVYNANDDFLFDSKYLTHYGMGFYNPSSGGVKTYFSGFYGMDFFSEGIKRISILRNGNVGINTSSPTSSLHVGGDMKVSGNYFTSLNAYVRSLAIVDNFDVTNERPWIVAKNGTSRQIGLLLTNDRATKAEVKLWEGNSHNPYISFSTSPNGGNMIERMRIDKYGRVGIGYSNPSSTLHVNGSITYSGGTLTSDKRKKRDIHDYSHGLSIINKVKVKKYKYKRPVNAINTFAVSDSIQSLSKQNEFDFYDKDQIGVIAQDIQRIAPELVGSFIDEDGIKTLTVNFTAFTFILINAVKEQQDIVENLQEQMTAIQKELADLKVQQK